MLTFILFVLCCCGVCICIYDYELKQLIIFIDIGTLFGNRFVLDHEYSFQLLIQLLQLLCILQLDILSWLLEYIIIVQQCSNIDNDICLIN